MGIMFYLSNQPSLRVSQVAWQDFTLRKSAHVTEYFLLTILASYSLKKTFHKSKKAIILLAIIISLLFAVSDEFHQTFVFGREGKIQDVIIDSVGIFSSVFLIAL